MKNENTLMFLSDAPSGTSGLSRITRELIAHIQADPETNALFRVATWDMDSGDSSSYPYPQYPITTLQDYVVPELPDAWNDFARGEQGILMAIWNPSWLWWLSLPRTGGLPCSLNCEVLRIEAVQDMGYFPIDAVGPSGTLPKLQLATVNAFDRKTGLYKMGWRPD